MKVLIARDRKTAGGGIFHYYQKIVPHLGLIIRQLGIGRSHSYYAASHDRIGSLPTFMRLPIEWLALVRGLLAFPSLVHLNPSLDIDTRRSICRDAVNVMLAKAFGRKVLVFWRGWDNEACGMQEFPGGNSSWQSRAFRMADAHIVLASEFRNDLRRWGFARPIHVETTVVGDEVMESAPAARQLDRSRPFRVLYLSRVEEAKGIFEMLEAFALLESRSPCGYEFTVAGDGPGLEELKDYASALGLKSLSFTGYLDGEEKIRCLQAADAFCFPSYTEGMPNAVLEAMAMGLPVVASAAGGLKDILEDGKCGFVLGYDGHAPRRKRIRPGEVADRIEQLAGDAVVYRSISLYNSRLARDRFAAPMVAGRLEAIYREVIGNGDRGKVMDTHSPCREEKNRLDACEPDSGSQSLTSGCRS